MQRYQLTETKVKKELRELVTELWLDEYEYTKLYNGDTH